MEVSVCVLAWPGLGLAVLYSPVDQASMNLLSCEAGCHVGNQVNMAAQVL
jgi:hypothetical protein